MKHGQIAQYSTKKWRFIPIYGEHRCTFETIEYAIVAHLSKSRRLISKRIELLKSKHFNSQNFRIVNILVIKNLKR